MSDLNFYQKNRDMILNRAKDYHENNKEWLREQEINTEIYLKKKKIKRKNMEEIDIIIYQKERNKTWKNIKKITVRLQSLHLITNKIVF